MSTPVKAAAPLSPLEGPQGTVCYLSGRKNCDKLMQIVTHKPLFVNTQISAFCASLGIDTSLETSFCTMRSHLLCGVQS